MHHRKATIGAITPDNAHPFEGKYFQLMQNGTAQTFYNANKLSYGKDTDTETLLHYIEDRTSKLEDIPEILEQLSNRLKEDLGIIIVVDKRNNHILFYADGARESYIDLDFIHMKVNGIYNYVPGSNNGFENVGHIILDFDFNIIRNTFTQLNKDIFYLYYSGGNSLAQNNVQYKQAIDYTPYSDDYYGYAKDSWETEREFAKVFNTDWLSDTPIKLTTEELVEYDTIMDFLCDVWDNINDITMSTGLKDYLIYQYWVDDMSSYNLYFEEGLRIDEVFKLAYKEAFGI